MCVSCREPGHELMVVQVCLSGSEVPGNKEGNTNTVIFY